MKNWTEIKYKDIKIGNLIKVAYVDGTPMYPDLADGIKITKANPVYITGKSIKSTTVYSFYGGQSITFFKPPTTGNPHGITPANLGIEQWEDINFNDIKEGDTVRAKGDGNSVKFVAGKVQSNRRLKLYEMDGSESWMDWVGDAPSGYEKLQEGNVKSNNVGYSMSSEKPKISNYPHKCPHCGSESYNNSFTAHVDCKLRCKESLKY